MIHLADQAGLFVAVLLHPCVQRMVGDRQLLVRSLVQQTRSLAARKLDDCCILDLRQPAAHA